MSAAHRVAVAVVLRGGRVLVQTRTAPGRYQGFWEFPGGAVEAGETDAACARRECLEELALPVVVGAELHAVRWSHSGRDLELRFLLCATGRTTEPRPLLGQELLWADGAALEGLELLPPNAAVVRRLAGRLDAGGT